MKNMKNNASMQECNPKNWSGNAEWMKEIGTPWTKTEPKGPEH